MHFVVPVLFHLLACGNPTSLYVRLCPIDKRHGCFFFYQGANRHMSGIWTRALKRLNGALISGIGTTCQMAAVRKVTFLQLFVFLKAPPWFSEFVRSVDWCPTPSVSAASPTSSMNPIPKRVSNYSMARGMDKTPAFLEQTNHRQRDCASCSQRQAIGTGFNCDESRGATSASCP